MSPNATTRLAYEEEGGFAASFEKKGEIIMQSTALRGDNRPKFSFFYLL